MHELSIVQALLEQVHIEVEKAGHHGRVLGLHLIIGRMSGVHVDSIRFAFELLSPESIADGAQLHIDEPQARFHCRRCGAAGEIDHVIVACPRCGESEIAIRGGQDLLLQSIELADEEDDH